MLLKVGNCDPQYLSVNSLGNSLFPIDEKPNKSLLISSSNSLRKKMLRLTLIETKSSASCVIAFGFDLHSSHERLLSVSIRSCAVVKLYANASRTKNIFLTISCWWHHRGWGVLDPVRFKAKAEDVFNLWKKSTENYFLGLPTCRFNERIVVEEASDLKCLLTILRIEWNANWSLYSHY